MTDKEFKAWFDGFCEAIGDVPTREQWEKIKKKVAADIVMYSKNDDHGEHEIRALKQSNDGG